MTRLIRVDVSTSANGVLTVALSEQEKGFAPYRLDNCTGLKLHLRCTLHHALPALWCWIELTVVIRIVQALCIVAVHTAS